MDKKKLIEKFAGLIEEDLKILIHSAQVAHEAATHTESKAEDQYDTRGLEASYLAGAQARRASQLESDLRVFRTIEVLFFSQESKIQATAFVTVECDGKSAYYLFMPCGGGLNLSVDGKRIQVVTPQSPIGEALLGKKVGDQFTLLLQGHTKDFDIISVE